jgi:hypothetical protein
MSEDSTMDEQNQDPTNQDPIYRILRDVTMDDTVKADIWDDAYESRSTKNFVSRLQRFEIPDNVKAALVAARKSLEPSERERVVEAIKNLSTLDAHTLATAEAHPNLLRFMIDAAKKEAE